MRPQCDSHAPGNAQTLLEVRSKERTHLPAAPHLPYAPRFRAPEPHANAPSSPPPPSCSIRLLLIVTQVPAHASDASNNNPTTINPPLGAVHVPISNPVQAQALVQILHVIRQTRGNGIADWRPKAIENTLREGRQHPAPYGDIVVALTRYATTSDKRVPNFLFDALADWAPKGQTAQRNPCGSHPEEPAHNCRCCRADYLAGIRTQDQIGQALNIPDTLETAMSRSNQ